MNKPGLIFFFILSTLSFLSPPQLPAKILDIQADGSGSYLTINEAIKAAKQDDMVLIGPGIFRESIEISKNDITLVGSGADLTHIEVTNNFCLSIENSSNIRIEDISFSLHSDTGDSTIYIDNSSVELSYCVVKSSTDAYGIYCISNSSVWIFHNNILHHKKEGGIRFDNSCEVVIKSNIFMGNSFGINNVGEQFASPDVSHNIFWKNGSDYSNCKKGSGDIFADPRFINPKKNDYRLTPFSPGIGVAHDGSEIGTFPIKKRPIRVKPKKVEPAELSLEGMLTEPGDDGLLNGGDLAHLIAVISNSGKGTAYNVSISYNSTSAILGEGLQEIPELLPLTRKEVRFPLEIPEQVADEEASITLNAVDKTGLKTEQVFLDAPILSVLGQLSIETDPENTSVYLDGTLRGKAPLTLEKLLPKDYQIRITLKDYEDVNETINLQPRADEIRQFVLFKLKGDLLLETDPPQAAIIFQGQVKGIAPLKIPFIDVGTYNIAAEKYTPDMIYRFKGQVTIKPGENKMKIDKFTTIKAPPGMILIPEGEFVMGSDGKIPEENPAHKIYLDNYYIDKYEVTWGDFMKFVRAENRPKPFYADDSRFKGFGYPAVGITYDEAQAYAKWVNKRLPTEAEWEKAARGNKKWRFPWGNEFSPDKTNCATDVDGYKTTAPVDSFSSGASPYGMFNMAGNVWEWCSDFYNATYYYVSPPRNPKGPKKDKEHVLRGGSWDNSRYDTRVTRRWHYGANFQRNYIGFRLVFPSE